LCKISVDVNSKVDINTSIPLNRCYVQKIHRSRTVTKPQQDDNIGRIQRAATTTHLDLEALEEEENPDYSAFNNNSVADSF